MNIRRIIICLICLALTSCLCVPVNAEEDISVSAGSAILIEPNSGKVLYSKNADKCVQMASTTKIMSTILTLESGNPDDEFVVDTNAIMVEGSSMGLRPGDIVTKRMLCYGMMLPSGNDAANASAVAVSGDIESFVKLMNDKAKELGLENTHFVTPSGLDDDTNEHYSSAYDMAKLTAYAMQNDDFKEICSTKEISFEVGEERTVWLSNSNKLLRSYDGCIGVKTGFTDKAGRCLISAVERGGVTLICVTLNAPNDWQDHTKLYDYGFDKISVFNVGGIYVNIPGVGGDSDIVTLYAEDEYLVFPKDENIIIEKQIIVPRFVYAPLDNGSIVGRIDYYANNELVYSAPLILLEDFLSAN
ncbi:MAG: D-alanyl-D-alanine carboxypeptidase [Oscillospiraceae bacterium]|nr:D-alanyl-D-alanine carboxypeptidase [Oscillospiraceae bacterium]